MGAVDKTGWVLGTVLARQGAALRDKPFVQFQDDPPYTFGDMDARANRVANALAALGVQRDERVLLMLPNSVAFLDAWFGINRLGAVMVPINTAYKGAFLEARHQQRRGQRQRPRDDYRPRIRARAASQ